ncbi:MAG: alpha/beta hydrolase [Verrucomicrobiales bacterium]|nr:alpha/beta hydrolase [Verrucomicrobiales bacterium]
MKRLLFCCLLGSLSAQIFAQEAEDPRLARWLKKFPAADANQDGKLTMEEARAFRDKQKPTRPDKKTRPAPTHANLKYGDHERNVIDLWLPEKPVATPTPVFIHFHGGGFVAGDKSGFDPTQWLDAGMAAASGNYRFVDGETTLSPTPMKDAARAVQFLKSKAGEFGLDPGKFALSGGSAGAVITCWIGYHDDLKNPDSEDPVEKMSSRVACLLPMNGPLNLDPDWIREHLGGPKSIHGSFSKMFAPKGEAYNSEPVLKRVKESSPWEFVTPDDPPTFLIYSTKMTEVPLPEDISSGVLVHHPYFGKMMKTRLDEIGVENQFIHGSDPRRNSAMLDYVKKQFDLE